MKCNKRCFECKFSDCICDDFDYSLSEELDRQILKEREIVEDSEPIRTGKRGRPKLTPKQAEERKKQQRIKSKKYYEEHKEERKEYQKKYFESHYREVRAYQNERYQRLKVLYGNEYFNAKNREIYRKQKGEETQC